MSIRTKCSALLATSALVAVFAGTSASAGEWYAGGGGGWFGPDHIVVGSGTADDGWMAYANIGRPFHNNPNWRVEGEFSYRSFKAAAGVTPHISGGGDIATSAIMLNILYDFHNSSAFTPFIGLGGGGAFTDFSISGPGISANDSDNVLAAQALGGVGWAISPNTTLDLTYRFFKTDTMKITQSTGKIKEDIVGNTLTVGLRWKFGAAAPPPPPPPPPPPVAPPQVFKIFFPWDKSTLTAEARKTVDEIAAQFKDQKISKIHIEGNTDTSGSNAYNDSLGQRRSDSVKQALIDDGIPASLIDTTSRGETNPAVQTGDNVKEPLNRRAEVTISLGSGPSS